MSNYLNFYVTLDDDTFKPLKILSFPETSDIYHYCEMLNPPVYICEEDFKDVSFEDISMVIDCVQVFYDEVKRRSKYRLMTPEEENHVKEYLYDINTTIVELRMIANMVHEIEIGHTGFKEMLVNID